MARPESSALSFAARWGKTKCGTVWKECRWRKCFSLSVFVFRFFVIFNFVIENWNIFCLHIFQIRYGIHLCVSTMPETQSVNLLLAREFQTIYAHLNWKVHTHLPVYISMDFIYIIYSIRFLFLTFFPLCIFVTQQICAKVQMCLGWILYLLLTFWTQFMWK